MTSERGLTLVELLVVVAILLVLAMILYPVYETALNRAEGSVCLVNLRNLATANALYADDYDDFCVSARVSGPAGTLGTCWDVLLLPYYRTSGILICPSDAQPSTTSGSVSLRHSYGINYEISMVGGYNGASLQLSQLSHPAQTVLFFDLVGSSRTMGTNVRQQGLSRVDCRHGAGANFVFVAGNARWRRPEMTLVPRHGPGSADYWAP